MKLFKYLNRIINERENTMNKFFETIYFEYKDDVYRLALSYTHNNYDAEDITQRTFIKVYKNINNIQKNNLKQYLLTITANECKDLFKIFLV